MAYEQQILKVLTAVGERGISMAALTKHVYNQSCTLFEQPDFEEVVKQVRSYVRRNARTPQSLLEHAGKRGAYRLNMRNSADARQLVLEFSDHPSEEDDQPECQQQDFSLSLFDDF